MKLLNKLLNRKPCAAVIVAAGSGTRMGGTDKILTELAGKPVIVHTIAAFEAARFIDEIIVVARGSQVQTMKLLAAKYQFQKVKTVIPGGASRMESVWNGLQAVSGRMEYVAVQDGARPMVTAHLIDQTVLRARRVQAAAPGIPVKDTVKQVDGQGMVVSTPPRDSLRAVQTPQVFQKDLLRAAWKRARKEGVEYTDDCAAMEAMGVPVYLIEGEEENIKLTTPMDLEQAERLLRGRSET